MNEPSPGELKHRIVIEAITSINADIYNQTTEVWSTAAKRWAKIEPQKPEGLSLLQADTRAQLQRYQITIRYFADLKVTNRIRYGTRYFRIVGIDDPDKRRTWQVIEAIAVEG